MNQWHLRLHQAVSGLEIKPITVAVLAKARLSSLEGTLIDDVKRNRDF